MKQLFFVIVLLGQALRLFCIDCPPFEAENSVVTFRNECDHPIHVTRLTFEEDKQSFIPFCIPANQSFTTSIGAQEFQFYIQKSVTAEENFFNLRGTSSMPSASRNHVAALSTLWRYDYQPNGAEGSGTVENNYRQSILRLTNHAPDSTMLYKLVLTLALKQQCFDNGKHDEIAFEYSTISYRQPKTLREQALSFVKIARSEKKIPHSALLSLPKELQVELGAP